MATFVHRLALCESDSIGDGTRIWAFAHVMHGGRRRPRLQYRRPCVHRIGRGRRGSCHGEKRCVDLGRRDDRRRSVHWPRRDLHQRSPSAQPANAGRRRALRRAVQLAERNPRRPRRQHRRRSGDHARHFDRRIRNDRRRRSRHSRRAAAQPRRWPSRPRDRLGLPMRPTIVDRRPL